MSKETNSGNKTSKLLIFVLIGAFVILFGFFISLVLQLADVPDMIQISNVFIDIDGNGSLDYVYKADVILNTVKQNLP